MESFIIMLRKVLMFVALALPGFVLVKSKVFTKEQSAVLSKILTTIAMLFFIMTATTNSVSFAPEGLLTLAVATIIGLGFTLGMYFLSAPLTCFEKSKIITGRSDDESALISNKKRGMLRFSSIFSNNGFLGIPLANEVLGKTSGAIPVLIVINIITNLSMLTLGKTLVSGKKEKKDVKKILLNPVIVGFVVGLILNLTNVGTYVPEITTFTTHFANLVTPISMTILGMKMGEANLTKIFVRPKTYYASFIKLIAMPTIIIALMFAVKGIFNLQMLNDDMFLGVFIAFSMPTATLSTALADSYDGDIENAVSYTLGTTILSIATIPLLYMLLNFLLV